MALNPQTDIRWQVPRDLPRAAVPARERPEVEGDWSVAGVGAACPGHLPAAGDHRHGHAGEAQPLRDHHGAGVGVRGDLLQTGQQPPRLHLHHRRLLLPPPSLGHGFLLRCHRPQGVVPPQHSPGRDRRSPQPTDRRGSPEARDGHVGDVGHGLHLAVAALLLGLVVRGVWRQLLQAQCSSCSSLLTVDWLLHLLRQPHHLQLLQPQVPGSPVRPVLSVAVF